MGKVGTPAVRDAGLGLIVVALALFSSLSCAGEDAQAPTTGGLELTTTTSGPEPDSDGYTISIDAGAESAIGTNATLHRDGIESGSHSVRLSGMAANCTVTGDNPRAVSVSAGETGSVTFAVTCSATVGSLQITVATGGASPDPDGYTVSVDGSERGALAVNGSMAVDGLPPGNHTLGLAGLAANCQLEGDNPRAVAITAGGSASVAFAITCAEAQPGAGSLRISTVTSGADLDPDGYALALDRGTKQPIGVSATATVANVAPGAHTVRLSDVAANCTVDGGSSRAVTVTTGATVDASFAILCTANSGSLRVTTVTTGSNVDPDGYTVSVDAGAPQPIGITAAVDVPGLAPGVHPVTLAGVSPNCTLTGQNPKPVTIRAGAVAATAFSISCSVPELRWTPMASGTTNFLLEIDGSAATAVFVREDVSNGTIRGYDGTSWSALPLPPEQPLSALRVNSPTDLLGVASGGQGLFTFMHYDGQQWSVLSSPPVPSGYESYFFAIAFIWASSASDVHVFGTASDREHDQLDESVRAHYDGTAWSVSIGGAGEYAQDVWGSAATDIYYLSQYDDHGDSGSDINHYDGAQWRSFPLPDGHRGRSVWGSSASNIYVTATRPHDSPPFEQSIFWHFDGTNWSEQSAPMDQPGPIWGTGANDIYVIAGHHAIWHFDGASWKKVYTSTIYLSEIWGSSATDVFVVGEGGTILHGTP